MIINDYYLQTLIGEGSYGEIYYTTKMKTNEVYATKRILKSKIAGDKLNEYFRNEIEILGKVNHENIMKLHEIMKSSKEYFLITEYCNGGTLTENLDNYKTLHGKSFKECHVIHILKQVADAILYLNDNNIMHRDLKLDNILLHYENEEDRKYVNILKAKVKIIDFGFARNIRKNTFIGSVVGSPLNMAPDLLQALTDERYRPGLNYNEKADIWSLGIIIFTLLIGRPPFCADDPNDLYNQVHQGVYSIPKDLKLSKECINLLSGMLMSDVKIRYSIDQILRHEFLTKPIEKFEIIDFSKVDPNMQRENCIYLDIKKLINLDHKPAVGQQVKVANKNVNYQNYNVQNNIPQNYKIPTTANIQQLQTLPKQQINGYYNYQNILQNMNYQNIQKNTNYQNTQQNTKQNTQQNVPLNTQQNTQLNVPQNTANYQNYQNIQIPQQNTKQIPTNNVGNYNNYQNYCYPQNNIANYNYANYQNLMYPQNNSALNNNYQYGDSSYLNNYQSGNKQFNQGVYNGYGGYVYY